MKPALLVVITWALSLVACSPLKPPKRYHFVVREQPMEVSERIHSYKIMDGNRVLFSGATNELGYFTHTRKKLNSLSDKATDSLLIRIQNQGQDIDYTISRLSPWQEIYLLKSSIQLQGL